MLINEFSFFLIVFVSLSGVSERAVVPSCMEMIVSDVGGVLPYEVHVV